MSPKKESHKLWESFPKINLSITILTEFQSVCDKIIRDAGVIVLRELCEKLLVYLHQQEVDVISSLVDDNVIISLVDDNLTDEITEVNHLVEQRNDGSFKDVDSFKDYINILPSNLCDDLHVIRNGDVISNIKEPLRHQSFVFSTSCRSTRSGVSGISVKGKISEPDVSSIKPARKQSYPCLQCNKSFIGSLSLNKHVQRKHPMKQKDNNCDTIIISKNNDSVVSHNKDINLVEINEVFFSLNENIIVSEHRNVPCVSDSNVTKCHQDVKCVTERPDLSQPPADKVTTPQQDNNHVKLSIVKSNSKTLSATSLEVPTTSQNGEEIVLQCSVQCSVCPKTFDNQLSFARHVKSHASCLECGKTYATPAHVRRHQRVHTGERPYVCNVCGNTFNDASTLKRHLMKHSDERKHVCSECGNRYTTNYILRGHMRRKHMVEDCEYLCIKCGKKYALLDSLKVHEVGCEGEHPYACLHCSKRFINASSVRKHIIQVHEGGSQFKCPVCSKGYSNSLRLARHVNKHAIKESALKNRATKKSTLNDHGTKQSILKERATEKSTLNNHVTRKSTLCLECGKSYATPAHLRRHQRVHTGERPFVCNSCGETFNDPSTLKKHNLRHTGERAHVCMVCGKRYRSNFTLVAHFRRTHNRDDCRYMCVKCGKKCAVATELKTHEVGCKGERPYACLQCSKRFSTAGNLAKHQRVHSGEKPYACSLCGKMFTQAYSVREHIKVIHNGERLFQCSKCNKTYSSRTELKRHDLVHSGERPYSCTQCDKAFSRFTFLKMHESKHIKLP